MSCKIHTSVIQYFGFRGDNYPESLLSNIRGLFYIFTCVCLPLQQTNKSMVIYVDRKKTLNNQETLGVHDGECHLRVRHGRGTF